MLALDTLLFPSPDMFRANEADCGRRRVAGLEARDGGAELVWACAIGLRGSDSDRKSLSILPAILLLIV